MAKENNDFIAPDGYEMDWGSEIDDNQASSLANMLGEETPDPDENNLGDILEDKKPEITPVNNKKKESSAEVEESEVPGAVDEVIDENDEIEEVDNFDQVLGVLKDFEINEELTSEHTEELKGLAGEDKVKRYLEIQKEIRDTKFTENVYKEVDNLIGSLPPKIQEAINLGLNGVEFSEALSLINQENKIAEITSEAIEESVDLQKKIIRDYLKNTGKDADEINDMLEVFETKDTLETKAKDYHKKELSRLETIKKQKAEDFKQQQAAQQKRQQETILDYEKTIEGLQEIVPGIKLSKQEKEDLKLAITKPIHTKDGNMTKLQITRMKDPKMFDLKVNYLNNLGVFNDPKAWEKIMKVGKTEQTKKVTSALLGNSSNTKPSNVNRKSENKIISALMSTLD